MVIVVNVEIGVGVILWIKIYDQYFFINCCECCCKINCSGCFFNVIFLICNGNDLILIVVYCYI